MQRISIENFGPIKKFEADVTDVMLLIGPQASGKSTISKTIFIFKSLKDEILNYIYADNLASFLPNHHRYDDLLRFIKYNFVQYFGLKPDCTEFRITYHYSSEKQITINKSEDHVDIALSFTLENELNLLITEILNYEIISKEQKNKFKSLEES